MSLRLEVIAQMFFSAFTEVSGRLSNVEFLAIDTIKSKKIPDPRSQNSFLVPFLKFKWLPTQGVVGLEHESELDLRERAMKSVIPQSH